MMTTSINRSLGLVANQLRANAPVRSVSAPSNVSAGFALPESPLLDSKGVASSKSTGSTNGLGFDFDFSFNNIQHTQAEYNAYYAEGAKKISASQGLPYGQYDFTNISPNQLKIVMSDMIVNQGKAPDEVSGFNSIVINGTDDNGSSSNSPMNAIASMQNSRDFERSAGNSTMADFFQSTIDYVSTINRNRTVLPNVDVGNVLNTLKAFAASRPATR